MTSPFAKRLIGQEVRSLVDCNSLVSRSIWRMSTKKYSSYNNHYYCIKQHIIARIPKARCGIWPMNTKVITQLHKPPAPIWVPKLYPYNSGSELTEFNKISYGNGKQMNNIIVRKVYSLHFLSCLIMASTAFLLSFDFITLQDGPKLHNFHFMYSMWVKRSSCTDWSEFWGKRRKGSLKYTGRQVRNYACEERGAKEKQWDNLYFTPYKKNYQVCLQYEELYKRINYK